MKMYSAGLSDMTLLTDVPSWHRPLGTAWPADPSLPRWPADGGVPPMVARGVPRYDGPPRMSGTGLDSGWTPSSWATMSDPSPYAMTVGGARYTHHAKADGLYDFKRLHFQPIDPLEASAANDWGLNPYDDNYAYLKEFHAWAEDNNKRMAEHGVEHTVYPDRWPGMSTMMARTNPLVPVYHDYPEAPPSMVAKAHEADTIDSVWATPATTEAMRRGYPAPMKPAAAPSMARGWVGRARGTVRSNNAWTRADWASPENHTVVPSQAFH